MNKQIIQNLRDAVEPLADLIREVDAFREPGQRDLPFEEGAARRLVAAVMNELGRLEMMQADHKRALEYAEERRQYWQNEAGREHQARLVLKDQLEKSQADYREVRDSFSTIAFPSLEANADLLEAVANEIDCGDGCEYGHTEHDTNAFVCRLMEDGTCGSTNAIELREIAKAFRVRAALPAARVISPNEIQSIASEVRLMKLGLTTNGVAWTSLGKIEERLVALVEIKPRDESDA